MKLFTLILSLIVLGQSFVPCADDDQEMNAGQLNATFINAPPPQQHDQSHNDVCSPFCQCSCCTGASINHVLVTADFTDVFAKQNFTSYLQAGTIEISLPIWQPPQLV